MKIGFILAGLGFLLIGALVLLTVSLSGAQYVGVAVILLMGLGLCVAGTPNQKGDDDVRVL